MWKVALAILAGMSLSGDGRQYLRKAAKKIIGLGFDVAEKGSCAIAELKERSSDLVAEVKEESTSATKSNSKNLVSQSGKSNHDSDAS